MINRSRKIKNNLVNKFWPRLELYVHRECFEDFGYGREITDTIYYRVSNHWIDIHDQVEWTAYKRVRDEQVARRNAKSI